METKLGECEVCGDNAAIYTCPRCEVKTCRLKCVKIHKHELDCDGQRNRTKYIPMKKFSNLDLLSDYRLLEEATRAMDGFKKTSYEMRLNPFKELPLHLQKIRDASEARGTKLLYMPKAFERRKSNQTWLDYSTKILHWTVQWIFPNAENFSHFDKCNETLTLADLLTIIFKANSPVLTEKLQYYVSVGLGGLKVLLQADTFGGKKFFEMDVTQTLRENLKKRTIVEYPIVHVVYADHADAYDKIDSDYEEEECDEDLELQDGYKVISNIIKAEKKEERPSAKNYLFSTELSDSNSSDGEERGQKRFKTEVPTV